MRTVYYNEPEFCEINRFAVCLSFHIKNKELLHTQNKSIFNKHYAPIHFSENLKRNFRPISMMKPDFLQISEIELLSVGYKSAKSLATKLITTYRLCSDLLSDQPHYDFGMRTIKSALRLAKLKKTQHIKDENEEEDTIVMRAITDVNLSKLHIVDVPIFQVRTIAAKVKVDHFFQTYFAFIFWFRPF